MSSEITILSILLALVTLVFHVVSKLHHYQTLRRINALMELHDHIRVIYTGNLDRLQLNLNDPCIVIVKTNLQSDSDVYLRLVPSSPLQHIGKLQR